MKLELVSAGRFVPNIFLFSSSSPRDDSTSSDVAGPALVVVVLTNHARLEAGSFLDCARHAREARSGNDAGAVSGRSTHGIRPLNQRRWYVQSDETVIFELLTLLIESLTFVFQGPLCASPPQHQPHPRHRPRRSWFHCQLQPRRRRRRPRQ